MGFGVSDAACNRVPGEISVPYEAYTSTPIGPDLTALNHARQVIPSAALMSTDCEGAGNSESIGAYESTSVHDPSQVVIGCRVREAKTRGETVRRGEVALASDSRWLRGWSDGGQEPTEDPSRFCGELVDEEVSTGQGRRAHL